MAIPTYSLLDLFFGPSNKRAAGVDLPKRPVTEFSGAVALADDETSLATRVRIGVAVDAVNDAEPLVVVRSKVGKATTTNATPLVVPLDTVDANGAWAVDVVVTCRSSDAVANGRVKATALVVRVAGATSITTSADTLATTGIAAALTVAGDVVNLQLTGVAATQIRWGYEARIQKQGY